jgi:hypothetical protein
MLVLFPSDPFETYKPEPDYVQEVEIAKECGHEVAFVHWEALVNDDDAAAAIRKVPVFEDPTPAIYRGWMLTSEQYEKLYAELQIHDVDLLTTPDAYRKAHEFPGWYLEIPKATPASAIIQKHEISMERLLSMAKEMLEQYEHGIIIKDYVKSRKHEWEEACFIPDMSKAEVVIANFLERQGDALQGGVVLREFVPLKSIGKHPDSGMPMGEEFRIFWMNGRVAAAAEYWPSEFYIGEEREDENAGDGSTYRVPHALSTLPDPQSLLELLENIDNPFVSMDLARAEDGEWFVMEIGDGQVSGLPRGKHDAELIYSRLDRYLGPPGIPADATPMTRAQFDGMTCHAEDCDHSSHDTEMYLHPKCHVGSPTWAIYEEGVINVKCSECDALVVRIEVAPGTVPEEG